MNLTRTLYRLARASNDVRAASRGPIPLAQRVVRKKVYRTVNRPVGKLLRRAGLG